MPRPPRGSSRKVLIWSFDFGFWGLDLGVLRFFCFDVVAFVRLLLRLNQHEPTMLTMFQPDRAPCTSVCFCFSIRLISFFLGGCCTFRILKSGLGAGRSRGRPCIECGTLCTDVANLEIEVPDARSDNETIATGNEWEVYGLSGTVPIHRWGMGGKYSLRPYAQRSQSAVRAQRG